MLTQLDSPPKESDATFIADYVELRTLLHPDSWLMKSDFEKLQNVSGEDSSREKAGGRWVKAISLARQRTERFGEFYPFSVPQDEEDAIQYTGCDNESKKAYLSLLLFSCLRYVERTEVNKIAREFELLCKDIFKFFLPHGSIVKPNWASPGDDAESYRGKLADKLRAINVDIRCTSHETIRDEDFSEQDTGDGGLDIVAWHQMHDDRDGIPIAVGQCSCSRSEWRVKQAAGIYDRHKHYFPLVHGWSNFYFCPLDLGLTKDKWRFKSDLGGAIIVDRFRILAILHAQNVQWVPDSIIPIIEGRYQEAA